MSGFRGGKLRQHFERRFALNFKVLGCHTRASDDTDADKPFPGYLHPDAVAFAEHAKRVAIPSSAPRRNEAVLSRFFPEAGLIRSVTDVVFSVPRLLLAAAPGADGLNLNLSRVDQPRAAEKLFFAMTKDLKKRER